MAAQKCKKKLPAENVLHFWMAITQNPSNQISQHMNSI